MSKKREWLAFRVNQKAKEILAYKGSGITFRELQKRLDFGDISYDAFRRHVVRIWGSPDALPQAVTDAAASPPVRVDPKAAPENQPAHVESDAPSSPAPEQRKRRLRMGQIGGHDPNNNPAKWRERFSLSEDDD